MTIVSLEDCVSNFSHGSLVRTCFPFGLSQLQTLSTDGPKESKIEHLSEL